MFVFFQGSTGRRERSHETHENHWSSTQSLRGRESLIQSSAILFDVSEAELLDNLPHFEDFAKLLFFGNAYGRIAEATPISQLVLRLHFSRWKVAMLPHGSNGRGETDSKEHQ